MNTDSLGLFAIVALIGAAVAAISLSRLPRSLKLVLQVALMLRLVGAAARYGMVVVLYEAGDSLEYFRYGVEYAERFYRLDFSPFWDTSLWFRGTWWGTQFVTWPSAVVSSFLGPTMLGSFVAFSLFSFLGLVGFGLAFRNSYPHIDSTPYLRWIWLFPSLWFWPSSIGKEAITLMGLGLAVAGFIGKNGRINWPLTVVGLFFVYAIRPQVAAVVVFCFMMSYWLASGSRWNLSKTLQGALIVGVGVMGLSHSLSTAGVDTIDLEGVQSYMSNDPSRRIDSGTSVDPVSVGVAGAPMALVNVLMRPFPFEAANPMVLASSLEIWLFWGLIWLRRKRLTVALRHWRSDRFLCVALPFILMYSIALGMMVTNVGIIARQRIFLFPFLFLLLEAAPRLRGAQQPAAPRQPQVPAPAYAHSGERL